MKGKRSVAPKHLLTSGLLLGLVVAGPVGAAAADGTATSPSPSPSPAPSPGAPSPLAVSTPPVANPDVAAVDAGDSVKIPVLANDTDDGLPELLSVVDVSGGQGRISFTPNAVTFRAGLDDAGDYTFQYTISDGEFEASSTVTVTVARAAQRRISIDLAKAPVARRAYTIQGRVRPQAASARAEVIVQRRTPNGWKRFDRTTAGSAGRWSVPFRTAKLGQRVFRAKTTLKDGTRATSAVLKRTVVARADVKVSGPLTAKQLPHSWRSGCPVAPSGLRKITVNYYDYRKEISRGSIVVRAFAVKHISRVFKASLGKRFPVRKMKPADAFYAGGRRTPMESDKAAMRAGNTSAFNCRPVTGNPYRISQHSYGNAIDINTIENPYVTGSTVYPAGSRKYLDRSPYRRGMILRGGVVANKMRNAGWLWGARWSHPDYQHFSSNGG